MLYIVLVLVLAALGLLVTALITANSLWAYVSIGLSVLAGLILFADWLRRKSRKPADPAEPVEAPEEAPAEDAAEESEDAEQTALLPATGELDGAVAADAADETVVVPVVEAEDEPEPAAVPVRAKDEGDPGEEPTDAADLLIVSELDVEVVVVDEYPRYHLRACTWLADRDLIPIGVSEARELGFTPCVRCGPDAHLATAHRTKKKSKADS
ncbi:hypothetical protein SAMN05421504_104174 [Amycolatopsis xylanica]|uniref:Uncharacterized protein n=1 Tax=Amycolatopsis xylanica TaxID=589385 RepID=A0A1H3GAX6_9PSEU|nr:hypothetical protein [Amycolatopsis xylanica]SDX99798.1 hypothetical protein SAMN05421504_104174 [Amycolatopsis xylanica]